MFYNSAGRPGITDEEYLMESGPIWNFFRELYKALEAIFVLAWFIGGSAFGLWLGFKYL